MPRRWRLIVSVLAALGLLLLAGRLLGPASSPGSSSTSLVRAGQPTNCESGQGGSSALRGGTNGPQRWPVPGMRLAPTMPAPGDLPLSRATALAQDLVPGDGVALDARLFVVTYAAAALDQRRAWVVAVARVPPGVGPCGPFGIRQDIVVLDARHGGELLHYTYPSGVG
jgi:hypothetical protein